MKPTALRIGILFSVLLFVALTASAQNNRSFVSTSGSDANTCTPGSECRSFTRAIDFVQRLANRSHMLLDLAERKSQDFVLIHLLTGCAPVTSPTLRESR